MDEVILQKEALRLPAYERALLADALVISLDNEETKAIEAEWANEAEHRFDAYKKGNLDSKSGPEVIDSLKSKCGKKRIVAF